MQSHRALQLFAVVAGLLCAWTGGAKAQSEIIVYTGYELEDLGPYKAAFERDNPSLQIRWVHDAKRRDHRAASRRKGEPPR